ncbi:hypothetical protein R3P38DRAFT_3448004 [Favolaschia claudopus]|uniref:Uncharacterized protein n=1 Tax=Favolaschia claudopus TaxID=2862362 RepID=A0AAW0CSS0_9AGAR
MAVVHPTPELGFGKELRANLLAASLTNVPSDLRKALKSSDPLNFRSSFFTSLARSRNAEGYPQLQAIDSSEGMRETFPKYTTDARAVAPCRCVGYARLDESKLGKVSMLVSSEGALEGRDWHKEDRKSKSKRRTDRDCLASSPLVGRKESRCVGLKCCGSKTTGAIEGRNQNWSWAQEGERNEESKGADKRARASGEGRDIERQNVDLVSRRKQGMQIRKDM